MHFLFKNELQIQAIQIRPPDFFYTIVLLGAAVATLLHLQNAGGYYLWVLIPLSALWIVMKLPSFKAESQTTVGVLSALAALVFIFFVNSRPNEPISGQGTSIEEWVKFKGVTAALPCLCILIRIISGNPSRFNFLVLGGPLLICASIVVYMLRLLVG